MNFLVDRCAGRRLTQWLQKQGHDARMVQRITLVEDLILNHRQAPADSRVLPGKQYDARKA